MLIKHHIWNHSFFQRKKQNTEYLYINIDEKGQKNWLH